MRHRLLNAGLTLTRTALHLTLTASAAWREWSAEYDVMRRQQALERAAANSLLFHVYHEGGVTEYEWNG